MYKNLDIDWSCFRGRPGDKEASQSSAARLHSKLFVQPVNIVGSKSQAMGSLQQFVALLLLISTSAENQKHALIVRYYCSKQTRRL
ncbi:hypothetical protein Mapa_012447 [Marchantia paleacea]|nr:hypothetical protein Mapa_012447 [Marchantia paleacea]